MLSIKAKENSTTSGLICFPRKNSCQANSRFSDKIISAKFSRKICFISYESPPQRSVIPIVQHLISAYKLWHGFLPHIPKDTRYSIGLRIDIIFIELIEAVFSAGYLPQEKKLPLLEN